MVKRNIKQYFNRHLKKYTKKCVKKYLEKKIEKAELFEKQKNSLKKMCENDIYPYFECCWFDDLHEGDIVSATTITNSQKYIISHDYLDLNTTKYGILTHKNNNNYSESLILQYCTVSNQFIGPVSFYYDLGTSGTVVLKKYMLK